MRELTTDDILPILKYTGPRYLNWLRAGLNDFLMGKEEAFFPLSSLTIYSEGAISEFLGAVYWALDAKAQIRFRKAVVLLLDALTPDVPEGLDECHRVLPPLLQFVAKNNIDCIDAIHRLTRSPQIVQDERAFLPIIEAAVGLSRHAKSEKLLRWLVNDAPVKDEHIPILLIAQANAASGGDISFLDNAWERLERVAASPHVPILPELWRALESRVSPAQLQGAFTSYMAANPSTQLHGILPGLKLRAFSTRNGEIRFQPSLIDVTAATAVGARQIWSVQEKLLLSDIAREEYRRPRDNLS